MPHTLGHLWGEGQKYVPKIACFLVHSFIFSIISVMEPMFSQIWNAFLTYVFIYIYKTQINETLSRHIIPGISYAFVISLLIKFSN